jgi:hypothetical protein
VKHRPSPALVVAILALVVAMAGTSYAATQIGSAQIKNNSVKGKDVKDANLTGKDVKDKSLTGADISDSSLTGADITDGSVTKADLAPTTTGTCPSTTVAVQAVCIDKLPKGPVTQLLPALQDCDSRHARLMTYDEQQLFVTHTGIVWADGTLGNYEWINEAYGDGANVVAMQVAFAGNNFGNGTNGHMAWYRCVTQP